MLGAAPCADRYRPVRWVSEDAQADDGFMAELAAACVVPGTTVAITTTCTGYALRGVGTDSRKWPTPSRSIWTDRPPITRVRHPP